MIERNRKHLLIPGNLLSAVAHPHTDTPLGIAVMCVMGVWDAAAPSFAFSNMTCSAAPLLQLKIKTLLTSKTFEWTPAETWTWSLIKLDPVSFIQKRRLIYCDYYRWHIAEDDLSLETAREGQPFFSVFHLSPFAQFYSLLESYGSFSCSLREDPESRGPNLTFCEPSGTDLKVTVWKMPWRKCSCH